jgi:hypothetical protein
MAEIMGLAASAAGGGLFGIVGTALGRVAGIFEQREHHAHQRALWAHQQMMQDTSRAAERDRDNAALERADVEGRWAGLDASVRADAAIGESYRWVNAVRGLTRPVLTFALWAITAFIFAHADASGRSQIIETSTFAATAATLWWFGDRGPKRRGA